MAILLIISVFIVIIVTSIIVFIMTYIFNGFLLWNPSPKIEFKQFVSFYKINPNRWDLQADVVRCEINDYEYIALHFNLFDYYRYKKWRKKINKKSIFIKNNEDLSKVIEMVKKDISEYKEA